MHMACKDKWWSHGWDLKSTEIWEGMVTSQDYCEDKRWQYVSHIWIYVTVMFLQLYHIAIISGLQDGHMLENCHVWCFRMLVPLHYYHYFQSTIYSSQGCKGPHMVFYLRTIACWLCYPHTNTPTLGLMHPHHPIRNRGGYHGGQQWE